jgi:hypothetical protein
MPCLCHLTDKGQHRRSNNNRMSGRHASTWHTPKVYGKRGYGERRFWEVGRRGKRNNLAQTSKRQISGWLESRGWISGSGWLDDWNQVAGRLESVAGLLKSRGWIFGSGWLDYRNQVAGLLESSGWTTGISGWITGITRLDYRKRVAGLPKSSGWITGIRVAALPGACNGMRLGRFDLRLKRVWNDTFVEQVISLVAACGTSCQLLLIISYQFLSIAACSTSHQFLSKQDESTRCIMHVFRGPSGQVTFAFTKFY